MTGTNRKRSKYLDLDSPLLIIFLEFVLFIRLIIHSQFQLGRRADESIFMPRTKSNNASNSHNLYHGDLHSFSTSYAKSIQPIIL